jgi:HD-GYP domain-containing protein (c-di-GMP phosphodiesterase class II)
MVRLSDIISKTNKKQSEKKSQEGRAKEEDVTLSDSQVAKVLSDTQILKVRGEKVSSEPSFKEEWNAEVVTYYEKFVDRAIDVRTRVGNDQEISASPILSDLNDIHNKDLVDDLYGYSMLAPKDHEWVLVHNVHVMFLSLLIGQDLGYDIKMRLKLGLAALVENVGMYKVPESVIEKRGSLDDKEMSMVREHPNHSYEILTRMGERYQWLAEVAVQVHERTDGSGYPRGLKGGEIYELSSIIGLIDAYVAMISDRPYRGKIVQTEAIKHILKEAKEQFPLRIRKAFLHRISLFPVNTHVRLNNGSIGRVVATHKDEPLRPTIELIYNSAGSKMEKLEVIQLARNPLLHIVEAIQEKDLP